MMMLFILSLHAPLSILHARSGSSGEQRDGIPTGEMSAQAFREWLLESHTSTGLEVGKADNVRKECQKTDHYVFTAIKVVL